MLVRRKVVRKKKVAVPPVALEQSMLRGRSHFAIGFAIGG
jgi:hypothetical protein